MDGSGPISQIVSDNPEIAQAPGEAIGSVDTATGAAIIIRVNGDIEPAVPGAPIFQGDTVETEGSGAIGIIFVDDSTFSLAENGSMTIDEMIYDPSGGEGSSLFNVAEGVFTFVSGEIAKNSIDAMQIETPIATIGIRGTAGGGRIVVPDVGPPSGTFANFRDPFTGQPGEFVVSTPTGFQSLSGVNAATSVANPFVPPSTPVVLPGASLQSVFRSAVEALPRPTSLAATNNQAAGQPGTNTQDQTAAAGNQDFTESFTNPDTPSQEQAEQLAASELAAAAAFDEAIAQGADIDDALFAAAEVAGETLTRFGADPAQLDTFTPQAAADEVMDAILSSAIGGLGGFGPSNPLSAGAGQSQFAAESERAQEVVNNIVEQAVQEAAIEALESELENLTEQIEDGLIDAQALGESLLELGLIEAAALDAGVGDGGLLDLATLEAGLDPAFFSEPSEFGDTIEPFGDPDAIDFGDDAIDDTGGDDFDDDIVITDDSDDTTSSSSTIDLFSGLGQTDTVSFNSTADFGVDVLDFEAGTDLVDFNVGLRGTAYEDASSILNANSTTGIVNITGFSVTDVTSASDVESLVTSNISNLSAGSPMMFVVGNGSDTGLWYWNDADSNGSIASGGTGELELIATLAGVSNSSLGLSTFSGFSALGGTVNVSGTQTVSLTASITDTIVGTSGSETITLSGAAESGDSVDLSTSADSLTLDATANTLSIGGVENLTIGSGGTQTLTFTDNTGVTISNASGTADAASLLLLSSGAGLSSTWTLNFLSPDGGNVNGSTIDMGDGTDTLAIAVSGTNYLTSSQVQGVETLSLAGGTLVMESALSSVNPTTFSSSNILSMSTIDAPISKTISVVASDTSTYSLIATGTTTSVDSDWSGVSTRAFGGGLILNTDVAYDLTIGTNFRNAFQSQFGPTKISLGVAIGNTVTVDADTSFDSVRGITFEGATGTGTQDISGTGHSGGDTIEVGTGNNTVSAEGGTDTITIAASGFDSSDTLDGGLDSDTLSLTGGGTVNDSAFTNVSNMETLQLDDAVYTITLGSAGASSAFSGGITVTSNQTSNALNLDASAYTTGGVTLTAASSTAADTVTGSSSVDNISTGGGADVITGGAGNDTLDGGDGSDTYIYGTSAGDDTINDTGASGSDLIRVDADTSFTASSISGIEAVTLNGATNIIFSGTQVANFSTVAFSNSFNETFNVSMSAGSSLDLSSFVASSFESANDTFNVNGTSAAETYVGSSINETISLGADNDTITTGGGTDTITFNLSDGGVDTVTDFTAGASGDILNFNGYSLGSTGFSGLKVGGTLVTGGIAVITDDIDITDTTTISSALSSFVGIVSQNQILVVGDGSNSEIYYWQNGANTTVESGELTHIGTLSGLSARNTLVNTNFAINSATPTSITTDPLVFDLDGDGVELLGTDAGVNFDAYVSGTPENIGWFGPDDALLVADLDGNGLIQDMSEVVSPRFGYGDVAANSSLDALAQLDDNNDGVIDALDEVFDKLSLWQDANSDGITDDGELLSLEEVGIASISLSSTEVDTVDNGNTIFRETTAETSSGSEITIAEVAFATSNDTSDDQNEQDPSVAVA